MLKQTAQSIDHILDSLQVKPAQNNAETYIQSLASLVESVGDVDGDIVEMGTFKGQNTIIFGKLIKEFDLNKRYYGFDSFTGYADIDIATTNRREAAQQAQDSKRWYHDLEQFMNTLEKAGVADVCSIVAGDLKVTFPDMLLADRTIKKISLLYIDCNAFLPAYVSMKFARHFMPPGAIICIDEHSKGGETLALETYASEYGLEITHTEHTYPNGPPMYLVL